MADKPTGYCPLFGNYPAEYNRAVHGPYYPYVNYGPTDTPIGDVKLGELKNWVMRRNKTPAGIFAACSRRWFSWHHQWLEARYGAPTKGLFQYFFALSFCSMLGSYSYLKMHRNHKYHW